MLLDDINLCNNARQWRQCRHAMIEPCHAISMIPHCLQDLSATGKNEADVNRIAAADGDNSEVQFHHIGADNKTEQIEQPTSGRVITPCSIPSPHQSSQHYRSDRTAAAKFTYQSVKYSHLTQLFRDKLHWLRCQPCIEYIALHDCLQAISWICASRNYINELCIADALSERSERVCESV